MTEFFVSFGGVRVRVCIPIDARIIDTQKKKTREKHKKGRENNGWNVDLLFGVDWKIADG